MWNRLMSGLCSRVVGCAALTGGSRQRVINTEPAADPSLKVYPTLWFGIQIVVVNAVTLRTLETALCIDLP